MTNDASTPSDRRIVLVQCTKTKRDSAAPARNLYDESGYFCDYRAYAETFADQWYILSAKHGLVHPDSWLEPYDERGLDENQAWPIAEYLAGDLGPGDTIELLAGTDYTDPLIPALERATRADIVDPHRGLGIGERRSAAQAAVAEADGEQQTLSEVTTDG